MQYQLVRSRRKTVALIVNRHGNLIVRAPGRASLTNIERFIKLKRQWIERKIQEAKRFGPVQKRFTEGEEFWFLGQKRVLHIVENIHTKFLYRDGQFILQQAAQSRAKKFFVNWYRQQARQFFAQRAA